MSWKLQHKKIDSCSTLIAKKMGLIFDHFTSGLQAVADIIRTTLGPRSMLKMLLDATGGA